MRCTQWRHLHGASHVRVEGRSVPQGVRFSCLVELSRYGSRDPLMSWQVGVALCHVTPDNQSYPTWLCDDLTFSLLLLFRFQSFRRRTLELWVDHVVVCNTGIIVIITIQISHTLSCSHAHSCRPFPAQELCSHFTCKSIWVRNLTRVVRHNCDMSMSPSTPPMTMGYNSGGQHPLTKAFWVLRDLGRPHTLTDTNLHSVLFLCACGWAA